MVGVLCSGRCECSNDNEQKGTNPVQIKKKKSEVNLTQSQVHIVYFKTYQIL